MEIEYYNNHQYDQGMQDSSQYIYHQMIFENSQKSSDQSTLEAINQLQIGSADSFQSIPHNLQSQTYMSESSDENQKSFKKQMIAKPFAIVDTQQVQRPISEDRFFHLPGDVLIEINHKDSIEFSDRQKQINSIEKRILTTLLHLQPVQFSTNYKYICHLLDNTQDKEQHALSLRVKKYQVIAQGFNFLIKHLKKTYEQELDKLVSLQQQREMYKLQFVQEYINKNFTKEDYFFIGVNGIDFNQENISIKNIQISQKMLKLIGLKDDNISYFALRTGVLDYCSSATRQQIFNCFMDNFLKVKKGEKVLLKENLLTTIDGFTIVVDASLWNIYCQFPPELQYHSNYPIPNEIEAIFVSKIQINQTHINHLNALRKQVQGEYQKKKKHSYLNNYGKEDFHYALETQIFMEKFYPEEYKQFEKIQKEQQNEERLMHRGECGYRVIS
ncbi:hypothetical protein ABPG72_006620 [Tetrahymena utriculariae]